jgi:hypothetical protein
MELIASATGLSTAKTLSQALGSVAGGILLVVTTPALVFTGAAVTMLGAAVLTIRLNLVGYPPAKGASAVSVRGIIRDTVAVTRNSMVASILVISGLRTFVRGMWIAIAVIASLRLLHAGSAGVGLLMLAAGVGSLLAAPLSSKLVTLPHLGTPATVALVCCGMPLALIGGVPVFSVALALVVAWGVGMAVADVATSSLVCRLVEAPLVPRVIGAIECTKLALEGLGAFMAPVLASTVGVRAALFRGGCPTTDRGRGGVENPPPGG